MLETIKQHPFGIQVQLNKVFNLWASFLNIEKKSGLVFKKNIYLLAILI